MDVHIVGDDPIAETVATALADVDIETVDAEPADVETARFAVVADVAGASTFADANEAALAGNTPWIAVEIGGMGGHPLTDVDAAVSGFSASTGCFHCLRMRVESNLSDGERAERATGSRSTARFAGAVAGYECARTFAGEDRLFGHVVELGDSRVYARRRFLPVPNCDCEPDSRDRALGRDDDSVDLEAAVASADTVIDERVGIVSTLGEAESFPAPYYLASAADTSGFSDARTPPQAAGVDEDWNAAMMKAVGETLERYCGATYRPSDFVRAPFDELEAALSPDELVRPGDAPAFDPEEEHRWVLGENLETGDEAHLPAAAVQFPPPGEQLLPSITTGLGLGSSTVDALVSGLSEVIERDATMLSWYSTFEPLALGVDDDVFERLARRARGEGLTVTPLLVTQDVDVPVVSVAVHREGGWPQFAMGSAASLDAVGAARAALCEALQNWMELRALGPEDAADASGEIGEYASFPDAARSFIAVDGDVDAAAVGPDPVPTGLERLESLVSRATDAGLTPYAARLTTRDVEALGFEAVRVVVPEAQPLFTGTAFFGERANTVPADLGFEPRLEGPYHPYP
ncbi:YcaO-like family protein [Natronobiforma cellulositropha]|uniref:YcaO-like family protein n=1 Tax=Natronobiforma cellulositropha TaxID=1679076 RepID=UPI0021D58A78|nr:YcaO-like family protein [Natronobiforma cellulositropha]